MEYLLCSSGGAFRSGGLPIDLLAQSGLAQLQRLLPGFIGPAHARFTHDLPIQQRIAELPDGDRIGARPLRADLRRDGQRGLDGHPLAGVAGRVDIGQVVTGDLCPVALGLQRAVRQVECAEESEHESSLSL